LLGLLGLVSVPSLDVGENSEAGPSALQAPDLHILQVAFDPGMLTE